MADFNFYLNRQGAQGVKGDKGDTGFSPTIEVDTNTAAEYKLKITNENNQFVTDNLRGSAVTDMGGTYMRYNPIDGTMFAGNPDYATDEQYGEVMFATEEDIELGAEDKAVGADKLYIVNQTLEEHSSTMTSLQTQIDEIEGDIPTVGNGTISITFDGVSAGSFSVNQSTDTTISLTSPAIDSAMSTTSTSAVQNRVVTTRINSLESDTTANLNLKADKTTVSTLQTDVTAIEDVIPNQATSSNQLADKAFVNSSIATNTATFRGTFNSVAELEAYSGAHDINDYAFVVSTDISGNTVYNRYKFDGTNWVFEYALNNSSFTAVQFEAINSGITTTLVSQITTNQTNIANVANSIHDGTLTLTQGGSTLGTFSANAALNTTIDVPSMTTLDKDFIKQSKALESGNISSDSTVLAQVKEYAHSTFDSSKLTVIGDTPINITADGVASGFTQGNYLYSNLTLSSNFKIHGAFSTSSGSTQRNKAIFTLADSSTTTENYNLNLAIQWSTGGLMVTKTVAGTADTFVYNTNVNYNDGQKHIYDVVYNGTTLTVNIDGTTVVTSAVDLSTVIPQITCIKFGGMGANFFFYAGSLYLKESYIINNGNEIFNTGISGIDTIKPANYTITGTPTITDYGILMSSVAGSYVKSPSSLSLSDKKKVTIQTKFKYEASSASLNVLSYGGNAGLRVFIGSNGSIFFYSTSLDVRSASLATINAALTNPITSGDFVYTVQTVNFDTHKQVIRIFKTPSDYYEVEYDIPTTTTAFTNTVLNIGDYDGTEAGATTDLCETFIKADGSIVYQPCLIIPYTWSNHGSKVVDVAYRQRVQDAYEQNGTALYYTLDEINGNFTLPMCDIYGPITRSVSSTTIRNMVTMTQAEYDLITPDANTFYVIIASS